MAVLEDLQSTKRVFIRCPSCGENFPVAKARLFDATRSILPNYALALVNAGRQQIAESRAELRRLQRQATQRALAAVKSVRIQESPRFRLRAIQVGRLLHIRAGIHCGTLIG